MRDVCLLVEFGGGGGGGEGKIGKEEWRERVEGTEENNVRERLR